jgi:hypothetical protein
MAGAANGHAAGIGNAALCTGAGGGNAASDKQQIEQLSMQRPVSPWSPEEEAVPAPSA